MDKEQFFIKMKEFHMQGNLEMEKGMDQDMQ